MTISNAKVVALFLRMNRGDCLTEEERRLLSEVKELDLSYRQISFLEESNEITNLRSLDLTNAEVSSLEWLSELTNPCCSFLSGYWQVSSLEGLSELPNLRSLDLTDAEVTSLKWLSGLKNLRSLNLSGCWQVTSLDGFSGLTNLRSLNLSGCWQVTSLDGLSELTNLQSLDLSDNWRISSLKGLSGLKNLRSLNFSGCRQVSSLEELDKLKSLKNLNVSRTKLDRIPKWIVDLQLPFETKGDGGIEPGVYMKDVQLSEQPVSLFSQPRKLIEAYYQEEEQVPVNEAKVIFLGDGGVGKTYTIYRIEHDGKAPSDTKTTPGISITQHLLAGDVTINIWDFGGQEIMYSMHRCFLTERTCYVVIVNNRSSDVMKQARYWLKNIERFASSSTVILAVNLWDGVAVWDLDKSRLKREFPNLNVVVEYTATESKDIVKLIHIIEKEIDKLHSVKVKFPKSWAKIMEKLRNMTDDSGKRLFYTTKEQYKKICETARLQDVDKDSPLLLEWFNDLGVCFSYHIDEKNDELSDYMILNPEWLTNAVYIIINNGKKFASRGQIPRQGLFDILKSPKLSVVQGMKYSEEESRFILQIMRNFRLSFEVKDDEEDKEFIPSLLPNETPNDLRPLQYDKHLQCEIKYEYLPDVVVHRLMVDCAEELNFAKCWSKGLCVAKSKKESKNLFAVCDMNNGDNVLYIDVYKIGSGEEQPQKFLRELLDKIGKINSELKLKSTTWICTNYENKKISFQWSTLLLALGESRETIDYTADGGLTSVDVQLLLGEIFDEPVVFDHSESTRNLGKQIVHFIEEYISEGYLRKQIKEEVRRNMPSNVTQHYYAPVTKINKSTLSSGRDFNIDNSYKSAPSPSKEEFEQFRNELNKLVELTDAQKEVLYDAVGKLIDKLEAPEKEFQEQGKNFAMLTNALQVGKSVLGVTAQCSTIGNFLRALGIF